MNQANRAAARSRDEALERGRRITRSVTVSSVVALVVFGFMSSTHVLAGQTTSPPAAAESQQTAPAMTGGEGDGVLSGSDDSSQGSSLQPAWGFGGGSQGSVQAVTGGS